VITAWLTKVGLTIHPDKTRVCNAWEESFDFLGYSFGTKRRFLTGTRFLGASPSKKAQRRLKDRVNTLLYRGNPAPWPELREALNRLIAGWANYFSFGWTGDGDTAIHWHVAQRARHFLRKRHKLPRGSGRFSLVEVYGPRVGILDIWRYRKRAASRMPSGEASP
jgi:RNA-directed DNA polymerase